MNQFFSTANALRLSLIAAAALIPLTSASAQGLSLTLKAVGTAAPGSTVQYFGTFTNLLPDDNLYVSDMILGGDILNDTKNFDVDEDPFLANMPSFLTEDTENNPGEYYLTPGQKVVFEVFGVKIKPGATPGTLGEGTVDISGGGPGGSDFLTTDAIPFTTQVVPEAGALPLAVLGIVGAAGATIVRRRRAA